MTERKSIEIVFTNAPSREAYNIFFKEKLKITVDALSPKKRQEAIKKLIEQGIIRE